jgi:hypothetical protein
MSALPVRGGYARTFCEEMPRLANAPVFELDELVGRTLLEIAGCADGEDDVAIQMLFIRIAEDDLWHRLFLQAGIGFWEKWTEEEAFEDFLDLRRVDFTERFGLSGAKIVAAECIGTDWDDAELSVFRLRFDHGELTFRFVDPGDEDSSTVLDYRADTNKTTEQDVTPNR